MEKIVFYTNSFELKAVVDKIISLGIADAKRMGIPMPETMFCKEPEYVETGTAVRITVERVVATEGEPNVHETK